MRVQKCDICGEEKKIKRIRYNWREKVDICDDCRERIVEIIRKWKDEDQARKENADDLTPPNLYECDPEKNTECTKEGCFIDGGPCHMTVYEEFKKERTE